MLTKEKYNSWNNLKQNINYSKKENKYPKAGEIWYINMGINIGNESLGKGNLFKRPVLIIKKLGNLFFIVSMTTKGKENSIFYSRIDNKYFNKKSDIVLSQLKSIDEKRFILKIGQLSNHDFFKIKKELKKFIF